MKPKIIVKDREHLLHLVREEIKCNGSKCDLNHLDISNVTQLNDLFMNSDFNGDISNWNTSNVDNMSSLFFESEFNGDISKWDVSNVKNMDMTFAFSKFNGDISNWNTSNVEIMHSIFAHSKFKNNISKWNVSKARIVTSMFLGSKFKGDISQWKPYNIERNEGMLDSCEVEKPYWANIENKEKRNIAIDNYHLKKELEKDLNDKSNINKKVKI